MTSPTTDRRNGLVGNVAMKAPVTVLASSNITLSGQQTIDGVAVLASNSAGVPDRVLCTAQTDVTQNGIWDVSTGPWTRSKDANGNYDLTQGSTVLVNQGTAWQGTYWKLNTSGVITIGTTALSWGQGLVSLLSTLLYMQPSGGGSDDTSRLQALINSAPAGSVILLGPGVFKYSTVTIDKALTIRGSGKAQTSTVLRTTSAAAGGILITATAQVEISDLCMDSSVTQTGGAFIKVAPVSGSNFDSSFRRIEFVSPWTGINFLDAADFTVEDCYFATYVSIGVQVADIASPDTGDSTIFNNTFDAGGSGTGTAILQNSAGGLRILCNKFLNGNFHYLGSFVSAPTNTSILLIQGNSSEFAKSANFALTASSATTFSCAIIENNHITVAGSVSSIGIQVTDPGYAFLDTLTVGGNFFNLDANTVGMNLGRGLRVSLLPNQITAEGAGHTAITFGANIGAATVHPQDIRDATTRYSGTMTNVTFVPGGLVQNGTNTETTNLAYGSALWASSPRAVVFATPYPKAPTVTFQVSTPGVSGVFTVVPSTTGFTYEAIGATNGGGVAVTWTASGG